MELDHRYVNYFSVCLARAAVLVDCKLGHFDDAEKTCLPNAKGLGDPPPSHGINLPSAWAAIAKAYSAQNTLCMKSAHVQTTLSLKSMRGNFRLTQFRYCAQPLTSMSFSQDTNYLGRGLQDSALTDTPSYGEVEVDSYEASTSSELSNDDTRRFQRSKMAVGYCSPRLRTRFNAAPVPLSHPTPGLHSLQGVCTGNVERLEQTAERISSSSADIGSEIRELDRAQKRHSSSSASNSFEPHNGAFTPTATAYHGSILAPMRQLSVSAPSSIIELPLSPQINR